MPASPPLSAATPRRTGLRVEWAFAVAVLVLVARAAWFFHTEHYLPQPFMYDPTDTFMDWFNGAYWSYDRGTYDAWGSIYPPISFVFFRIFSLGRCYKDNHQGPENYQAGLIRDCDWIGIGAIILIYLLLVSVTTTALARMDRKTSAPRAIALSMGMPVLFALERGNVLTLCFACFVLAFGPLVRSARLRWLFAALAINFKIYLVAALFPQLLRRRWFWFEGAMICTFTVYVITYSIINRGLPGEITTNISGYNAAYIDNNIILWYQITFQSIESYLNNQNLPIMLLFGSGFIENSLSGIHIFTSIGQASVIAAAISAWFRPEAVTTYRLALLGIVLAQMSSEVGGYCEVFLIYLTFMERWQGFLRVFAIVSAYVLCLPADIILSPLPPAHSWSWLSGEMVEMHYGVALGMFLRPALVILIGMALSFATIADVLRDIREHGERGRRRFRHDWRLWPRAAAVPASGPEHADG